MQSVASVNIKEFKNSISHQAGGLQFCFEIFLSDVKSDLVNLEVWVVSRLLLISIPAEECIYK